MLEIYPAYFEKFKCSASKCTCSCCANWEIDIDPVSLTRYQNYTGPLAARFKEKIFFKDDKAWFRVGEDNRCPFLNEQNLCDIYIEMGEDALCETCTDHPRFFFEYDNFLIKGTGMACEEAAKLILNPEVDDHLVIKEVAKGSHEYVDTNYFGVLQETEPKQRDLAPDAETQAILLKDELLDFYEQAGSLAEYWLTSEEIINQETLSKYFDFLSSIEINLPIWRETIKKIFENLDMILSKRKDFMNTYPEVINQYKRMTGYFILRHYIKADEYEDVDVGRDSELQMAMLGLITIHLMNVNIWIQNGTFTFEDQVNCSKLFSREIEFSDKNTVALEDYII